MSFLDHYVRKHRLGKVSDKKKKQLKQLEEELNKTTSKGKGATFSNAIKTRSADISDLIERVSLHFEGWKLNWRNAFSSLKLVISISSEVYQIVDEIKDEIVPPNATKAEAEAVKQKFGQDLVWFIWMAVDPLERVLPWLPFKRTIEKLLVRWIAGMGIHAAMEMFAANKKEVGIFSTNSNVIKSLRGRSK